MTDGERRTNKLRTAKTSDKFPAGVEHELDKLLKYAPHLESLRNATRFNEESSAYFQGDILEDFRRKLRGE